MPPFFSPLRFWLKAWPLSFLGWGLVGLTMTAHGVTTRGDSWAVHLDPSLRHWLPWAVFTPLIFRLVAWLPLERGRWRLAVPVHLVAGVFVLFAAQWWESNFSLGKRGRDGVEFRPEPRRPRPGGPPRGGPGGPPPMSFDDEDRPPPPPDGPFRGGPPRARGSSRFDLLRVISFDLPIYLMLLTGAHALLFFKRDQERAASLARARLEALKMQLQPHFLFNTLNTIAGLVHDEPDKADAVLTALSDLLRLSLESSSEAEVPLTRELEFVERYLAILHTRFEDRLKFAFEIAPETRVALVPFFLLQPLVENAVRHGLEPKPAGGTVTIRSRREGNTLRLTVADDGVGAADLASVRESIGLGNTRARLRELYGTSATLTFRNGQGFTVEVTLPFRTAA